MTAIGSLVFCNDCGNLLEARTSAKRKDLKCDVCGAKCKDTSDKVIITTSQPSDYPSALRDKREPVQILGEGDRSGDTLTNEPCEKCGATETMFHTQQLRSADEGSTVFYRCNKCQHRWQTDN